MFDPLSITAGYNVADAGDLNGDGKTRLHIRFAFNADVIGNGDGTFYFQSLFCRPGYDYVVPEDIVIYNSALGPGTPLSATARLLHTHTLIGAFGKVLVR